MNDDETVIEVDGDTVTTRRGRVTVRYYAVQGRVRVGDVISARLVHERRSIVTAWSPFDAPNDDVADDDADPGAGRRIF